MYGSCFRNESSAGTDQSLCVWSLSVEEDELSGEQAEANSVQLLGSARLDLPHSLIKSTPLDGVLHAKVTRVKVRHACVTGHSGLLDRSFRSKYALNSTETGHYGAGRCKTVQRQVIKKQVGVAQ